MLNSIEDWIKSLIQVYTLRNYKKNQMKAKRSKEVEFTEFRNGQKRKKNKKNQKLVLRKDQ